MNSIYHLTKLALTVQQARLLARLLDATLDNQESNDFWLNLPPMSQSALKHVREKLRMLGAK